jgi:microcystin-dependent protein
MQQIPAHTHPLLGSTAAATSGNPSGQVLAQSGQVQYMIEADAILPMRANAISPVGGSQPHENCQPFLGINYIISLFGIFPSQT